MRPRGAASPDAESQEMNRLYAAAEHDCGRRVPLPRMQSRFPGCRKSGNDPAVCSRRAVLRPRSAGSSVAAMEDMRCRY